MNIIICPICGGRCNAIGAGWKCEVCGERYVARGEVTDMTNADRIRAMSDEELAKKENFIDFACSGVPNLSPYCLNRHPDCVDERGWCRTEKCRGFSRERSQKED